MSGSDLEESDWQTGQRKPWPTLEADASFPRWKGIWETGGSQLWLNIRVTWVLFLGPPRLIKAELLEGGAV